jgi:hypothetical protein
MRVTNGIPLRGVGRSLFLPVDAVNSVQILKANLAVPQADFPRNRSWGKAEWWRDNETGIGHVRIFSQTSSMYPWTCTYFSADAGVGTVRVFRPKPALEDAIGFHTCLLEASTRVPNGIPLGRPLPYRLTPVNRVQTLKG